MKKLLSLILALMMIVCCMPALAASEGYLDYTHPTQGYSVEYPESWIALDSTNIEAMMKSLADNEEFSALNLETVVPQITQMEMTMFMDIFGTNINIVGQEVGMSLTASAFLPMMPQMAQQVTASLPDAKLLDTGSLYEIGGNQYCTLCASYTPDGELLVEVSDSGKGIADVAQAMTPFYTSRPQEERSGMGFAVMQTFMDHVEVTSRPGLGTVVRMHKTIAAAGGK